MKLRFEVETDGRYVTIEVGKRAAQLYGRFSETQDDEDFEELVEEVMDDLREAILLSVTDVEIGR